MPGQDFYSDASAPTSTPAEATEPKAPAEGQEGETDSGTAVLPKAILGGKEWKPGEEIVLQIVQVNEDGAVVKYASEEGGEKTEEPPAEAPSMGGGGNPGNSMYG